MIAAASPTTEELPIAVIGGGATGLAAAYRLTRMGKRVRLFESSRRLGGAVRSERDGEWLVEAGPNSLQENSKELVALFDELRLREQRIEANPSAKKRFIVKDGRPCPVPSSPPALFSSPLFSVSAKIGLFTEILKRRVRRTADVSLETFVREHFGQQIVDYALNPFVSGVYAGDPAKLSARHAFPLLWEAEQSHGSLLRGMIARGKQRRAEGHPKAKIVSFPEGLETIIRALAAGLEPGAIELEARIESLVPGAEWKLVWSRGGETYTESFQKILVATPAYALSKLTIGSLAERPLAVLESIEYPPVSSLFLGFRREHVEHPLNGFGVLAPACEKLNVLGVLFSSTLFPRRAPEGFVALTVMVGGSLHPELTRLDAPALLQAVRPDLQKLLGVKGEPIFQRLNIWPRAIPQYQLGYDRYLDAIAAAEAQYPGLLIGGHVRDGIALNSCLLAGAKLAGRAAA